MAPREGFEPTTLSLTARRSTIELTRHIYGVPTRIRTLDLLIKSQVLYRLSYGHASWSSQGESNPEPSLAYKARAFKPLGDRRDMEHRVGFEPTIMELQSIALPLGYRCYVNIGIP